jgi:hypothetical protein
LDEKDKFFKLLFTALEGKEIENLNILPSIEKNEYFSKIFLQRMD